MLRFPFAQIAKHYFDLPSVTDAELVYHPCTPCCFSMRKSHTMWSPQCHTYLTQPSIGAMPCGKNQCHVPAHRATRAAYQKHTGRYDLPAALSLAQSLCLPQWLAAACHAASLATETAVA